jgi:hypothetical protein
MKKFTQKFTKYITYLAVAALVGVTTTYAIGTLTPTGTAGDDTHYSLKDIQAKLTDFTADPTATSSPFTVPGSVTASFPTLTEIYDLLTAEEADIVPEKILTGTTIFGVEGEVVEGTPELEWSSEQGSMNWDTAVSTCDALTEGGATAGDWRLPTISELLVGIADDWIVDGTENRFAYGTDYWSGTENSGIFAWIAKLDEFVYTDHVDKANTNSVRCVR